MAKRFQAQLGSEAKSRKSIGRRNRWPRRPIFVPPRTVFRISRVAAESSDKSRGLGGVRRALCQNFRLSRAIDFGTLGSVRMKAVSMWQSSPCKAGYLRAGVGL